MKDKEKKKDNDVFSTIEKNRRIETWIDVNKVDAKRANT